ncbi:hypothetical protein [Actinoplanes sp. NPDC051859]|uniref:hypothetical protein n=1 Tax=Actinoplanes sp. NPDC051859 TaxID=3363909 RepID=UPI00378BD2ED
MTFLTSPTERSTTRDHPRARDAQGAARRRNDADVRGTRLPATFDVTAEMEEWARRNTPDVAQSATDAFRDYWRARPDPEGRKADWLAAWRGWMRREQATIERQPGYRGPARQTAPIAAIRIPVEAMCRDHRGHRAATCGLCRSERIEAR